MSVVEESFIQRQDSSTAFFAETKNFARNDMTLSYFAALLLKTS
jgi:hypothetical protein